MEIITDLNILKQKSKPIDPKDIPQYQDLIKELEKTRTENKGLGLSAIQIGKPIQLFVFVSFSPLQSNVVINPEIIYENKKTDMASEGCLSLPGVIVYIARPYQIKVKYLNEKGEEQMVMLFKLDARVFLHEYDHLRGVLIIDSTI